MSVSFGPARSCSLRVFGFVRSGFRVRFRFTVLELEDGLGRTQFYHRQRDVVCSRNLLCLTGAKLVVAVFLACPLSALGSFSFSVFELFSEVKGAPGALHSVRRCR